MNYENDANDFDKEDDVNYDDNEGDYAFNTDDAVAATIAAADDDDYDDYIENHIIKRAL